MLHIVFLRCFPSVVSNTQRSIELHLFIYHPLFARVIYHMASEMMFLCLRHTVKGFRVEPLGKDCEPVTKRVEFIKEVR